MTTNKLISFHGKQEIKDKYLERLQFHYDADQIIKGTYWENGKGCAVGCTIHSGKHDSYESELGITWRLALLEDSLFERLPNKEAKEFPLLFLKSMPIGIDTDIVFKNFILWNLADEKEGLIYHIKNKEEIALLKEIADTYKKSFTEKIPQKVWKKLADKAASASAYAYAYASASASAYAYAYAYAYASASASAYASASASYAYVSAYASAYAYAYASASAYASAEWQKKYDERILRMRDKLIELMVASGEKASYPDTTKELAVFPEDKKEVDVVVKQAIIELK